MIPIERLREILRYDPESGIFYWLVSSPSRSRKAGTIAGYRRKSGYCHIEIADRKYEAHRVAWALTHGIWPPHEIDHRNADPSDNRLCNLRLATHSQNCANRRSTRVGGLKGTTFNREKGKWQAKIGKDGRTINLGFYSTAEEAHAVYVSAAHKLFGSFARAA